MKALFIPIQQLPNRPNVTLYSSNESISRLESTGLQL
jgi:hypothetical protein